MFMALKDVFKVSRKTFLDPKAWVDYDGVKRSFSLTWAIVGGLFAPPVVKEEGKETFEEAIARFGLTEAEIQEKANNYLMFSLIFVACGSVALLFSFYLLFYIGTFLGFILGFAVVLLFSAQAFRYHFWYFQIKCRKLGCTFEEWWQGKPNTNQE